MSTTSTVKRLGDPTTCVTLAEAKAYLNLEHTFDDTMITELILSAQEQVEDFCEIQTTSRQLMYPFDCFPGQQRIGQPFDNIEFDDQAFLLYRVPAISIDSITYYDEDNVQQTLNAANYYADLNSKPVRVFPLQNISWPTSIFKRAGGVQVTYTAGFGDAEDVPAPVKLAIKRIVNDDYSGRNSDNIKTTEALDRLIETIGWKAN